MSDLTAEEIVWLDHCEPPNDNVWWHPDDISRIEGPSVVRCVSYVVREETDWLVVVAHLTDDGCTSQPTVILKNCIVSRANIRVKRKRG